MWILQPPPYAYGHGYVHPYTTNASKRWRTVMAYNNRCTAWGYDCTRLKYWSNPTKTFTGDPLGDTHSENYKVLNNTAYTVANFRTQKIDSDFYSSFNSSSSGWSRDLNVLWGLVCARPTTDQPDRQISSHLLSVMGRMAT